LCELLKRRSDYRYDYRRERLEDIRAAIDRIRGKTKPGLAATPLHPVRDGKVERGEQVTWIPHTGTPSCVRMGA
jgi:hypothetical protein